jgi:hypothetical protein
MHTYIKHTYTYIITGAELEPVPMASDLMFKLLVHEAKEIGHDKILIVNLRCDSPGMEVMGKPGLGRCNFCVSCQARGMTIKKTDSSSMEAASKNSSKVHHYTAVCSTPDKSAARTLVAEQFPGNEAIKKLATEREAELMTKDVAEESIKKYKDTEGKEKGHYRFKSKYCMNSCEMLIFV